MIRLLQVTYNKQVPSTAAADTEIKTGMGVLYDIATNTVEPPAAETAENIFFADKERIPTGRNAGIVNLSDYEEEFNTILEGELCQRYKTYSGERVAVDQYADAVKTATAGSAMVVGTDGKWTIAANGVKSRYQFGGMYDDAGHALAIIETLDSAIEN